MPFCLMQYLTDKWNGASIAGCLLGPGRTLIPFPASYNLNRRGSNPQRAIQSQAMRRHSPDLVLFDLDNTLLANDSDFLWNAFICEVGVVEKDEYRQRNRDFYRQYRDGKLDIDAYLRFSLEPISKIPPDELSKLHEQFMDRYIDPLITPAALELVDKHREAGDITVIITATNRFVTEPIAARFNVAHLIATEPEYRDGWLTGKIVGVPCFREGKVECLRRWLEKERPSYRKTRFYSDSYNDLPLLSQVDYPVVVNGDAQLRTHARDKSWLMISLH